MLKAIRIALLSAVPAGVAFAAISFYAEWSVLLHRVTVQPELAPYTATLIFALAAYLQAVSPK